MVGHPGHGDGFTPRLAALGQGDIQQRSGAFSVIEKQLVKIPHAVKQQYLGVLALDVKVLRHHWRMGGAGL